MLIVQSMYGQAITSHSLHYHIDCIDKNWINLFVFIMTMIQSY